MKCPKCGFISFDFNLACPKCSKDISKEQEKLNLPPFRPKPPALLGGLTGDANESQVGMRIGDHTDFDTMEHDEDMLDLSSELTEDSIGLDDSGEMEITVDGDETGFDPETDDGVALDESGITDIGFETGEISLDDDIAVDAEDELTIDMDDLGSEGQPAVEEEELTIDMDDLSAGDEEIPIEASEESGGDAQDLDDLTVDLDDIALDSSEGSESEEEVSFDSDDLSVDLGDIALDGEGGDEPEEASIESDDIAVDLGDIALEEGAGEEAEEISFDSEDLSVDLGDLAIGEEEPAGETAEEILEIDDLGVDLDDISLEESDQESSGLEVQDVEDEPPAIEISDESGEIDLASIDLGAEKPQSVESEDEIEISLDDLKVNETGQLEIGDLMDELEGASEDSGESTDLDDLSLDGLISENDSGSEEISLGDDEDVALDLDDFALDVEEPATEEKKDIGTGTLDLEDLDIELDLDKS